MPERTFHDYNVGAISQGSVSVIDVTSDFGTQDFPVSHARIVAARVRNKSNLTVEVRELGGAEVPANTPRRYQVYSPQVGILSPNGDISDGEVLVDVTIAWGPELEDARQAQGRAPA